MVLFFFYEIRAIGSKSSAYLHENVIYIACTHAQTCVRTGRAETFSSLALLVAGFYKSGLTLFLGFMKRKEKKTLLLQVLVGQASSSDGLIAMPTGQPTLACFVPNRGPTFGPIVEYAKLGLF